MKKCAYCGRVNDDAAKSCAACGTSEFTPATSEIAQQIQPEPPESDVLPRDHPKIAVVAGFWVLYGSGLIGNLLVIASVLTGSVSGMTGLAAIWLSSALGALCVYLLYRSAKNYCIQKERALRETMMSDSGQT